MKTNDSFAAQFEKRSAWAEWRLWLAIMAGCCAVMTAEYVATRETYSIYAVIVGLFIGTLVKNARDIAFLDREQKLATEQVELLNRLNDVQAFIDTAPRSIFRTHIASLYNIFLHHPEIAQDNLIEVLHSRLLAKNRTVELFASVLITLGLIGTIVGLIQTVGGLTGALQLARSGGSEAMLTEMTSAVQGLDTAFITTLLGAMGGGVILRVLTSVVDAAIMRYTAHLGELTEVNVLPALRRIAAKLEADGYYKNLDGGDVATPGEAGRA